MRIARGRLGVPSEERGPTFTGQVWADPILPNEDGVLVNTVFFEPGSRTHWHTHDGGQVLYVTHGRGWAQTRDGEGGEILPGDVVHFAPGEEHWHGAAPDSYVLHVAISLAGHEWLDPVSDDDYASVFDGAA